ncbi:hypothetical protein [Streptomyces sp. MBT53]|uniref:hypothetical protein n=1 Tax=Streptomyces sp. MBT53 TaxID=1488384 RepID=UPI0019133C82|nr:hypothetical protein [Streptomyces sp. MBT53]MBK6012614.1 hypothetical protein [Streptomyces sp. MBT53]
MDIDSGPGRVGRAPLPSFDELLGVGVEPGRRTEAEAMFNPPLDTAHRPQLRHGDHRDAFELAVTNAVTPLTRSGVLTVDNTFSVLTAGRPSAHESW